MCYQHESFTTLFIFVRNSMACYLTSPLSRTSSAHGQFDLIAFAIFTHTHFILSFQIKFINKQKN